MKLDLLRLETRAGGNVAALDYEPRRPRGIGLVFYHQNPHFIYSNVLTLRCRNDLKSESRKKEIYRSSAAGAKFCWG